LSAQCLKTRTQWKAHNDTRRELAALHSWMMSSSFMSSSKVKSCLSMIACDEVHVASADTPPHRNNHATHQHSRLSNAAMKTDQRTRARSHGCPRAQTDRCGRSRPGPATLIRDVADRTSIGDSCVNVVTRQNILTGPAARLKNGCQIRSRTLPQTRGLLCPFCCSNALRIALFAFAQSLEQCAAGERDTALPNDELAFKPAR
jgi:hypothetical protein